jgi:trehalose utilization protein
MLFLFAVHALLMWRWHRDHERRIEELRDRVSDRVTHGLHDITTRNVSYLSNEIGALLHYLGLESKQERPKWIVKKKGD